MFTKNVPFVAAGTAILLFSGLVTWLEAKYPEVESAQVVTLTVDYGDGFQKRFVRIPWKKEMTVGDATNVANEHPRGIEIEVRGRDKTALLLRIDDLRNAGAAGKNWVYRVNDQLGDRSFRLFSLEPGDAVLWRFEEYP